MRRNGRRNNGRKHVILEWTGLFLVVGMISTVYGLGSYMTAFNNTYGTSATVLNTCGLCHIDPAGGGARNGYGNDYLNAGHSFVAIEALDSDGDGYTNIAEINARTLPGDATSHPLPDTTPPVVSAFTLPAASTSLTVGITSLAATDAVGVTGYVVTETAAAPATGWTAAPPASYTFATPGAKTLYGWARDAAGNVSAPVAATTTITLTDLAAPTISVFVIPATSTSLIVPVTTFTAADNVAVTGYLVTETATPPSSAPAVGWTATPPASYTFRTAGSKTLYGWAVDAAGNVSTPASASTNIALADTQAPVVSAFVCPASSGSMTVSITTFTATDNVGVTGYLVTETATPPSAAPAEGWTAAPAASYTFTSQGKKTLYAWAKDGAGNVSVPVTAAVDVGTVAAQAAGPTSAPDATTSGTLPDLGGGEGRSGCFIATAAFGSYFDPYVRILRNFRDVCLLPSGAGQSFVSWYYRVSPPIAEVIARHDTLRSAVRLGLLPLVGFGALSLNVGFMPAVLILLLSITLVVLLAGLAIRSLQVASK